MRFLIGSLVILLVLLIPIQGGLTQPAGAEPGDPPLAALIDISEPDEADMVTISGAAGSVFPSAQVAIRNLHTGQIVYATANFSGAFSAQIYGPGSTPFWISPAESIPSALRDRPGSLPGGPGTIVTSHPVSAPMPTRPITQIVIDGAIDDWAAYPRAATGDIYALLNADSLTVATRRAVRPGERLVLVFSLDANTYELAVDPTLPQAALLEQVAPEARDLGTRAVAVAAREWIELRLPLRGLPAEFETAILDSMFIRAGDETERDRQDAATQIPRVDEIDGIVYPGGPLTDPAASFSVAGSLAQGRSSWQATGRVDTLAPSPGDTVTLELDITLDLPDLAAALPGLALIGEIGLQPVTVGADGSRNIPARYSNNGWSNLFTLAGLPIDNLYADLPLGTARVAPQQVIRRGDQILAGFRFELTIPADLPPGIYVPVFTGRAQIGDSDLFSWAENSVIFGDGPDPVPPPPQRLPLVFNVGGLPDSRLLWPLLVDHPGDGSRGLLPATDSGRAALSNRVRFNSPTLILPPGEYPIEPYLLNMMPNAYDMTSAPLLPLALPGGQLNASVTRPDGTVDALPGAPIVQNRLSTAALDERDLFGAQAPLDVYRLTTLNPVYTAYPFEAYGEYTINLSGSVADVFGNRYGGGGVYRLLIAEPLKLLPGVLPGTPFHVGDAFYAGGQVLPGMPAAVSVRLTIYPVDGSAPVERVYEGRVNPDGVFTFADDEAFIFDQPGEYVIDYEARYTLPDGRLWAASQRSAGIIADPDSPLVARGLRGLAGVDVSPRPAWFTTATYPPAGTAPGLPRRPYFPYHSGDVAYVPDSVSSGIHPALSVQDLDGAYAIWLREALPDYVSASGQTLEQLAITDSLPLLPALGDAHTTYSPALLPDQIVNHAYAYISAVQPGVTVRQFVAGGDDPALAVHWDADDPLNRQIGAGIGGGRHGDYVFLFGGAVVRNGEANIHTTAAYAALAITTASDSPARVLPPFGAAGGGPLLTIDGQAVEMFLHPTGARPGQVFRVGDMLTIAGQAAPTVAADVTVTISAPSGQVTRFNGITSPTGYFYQPQHALLLDEPGMWTVRVNLSPAGLTSAGAVPSPLPVGGIPGAPDGVFTVYVANTDDPPLAWSGGGDIDQETRPGTAQNLGIEVPAGWTDASASYVVASPSYVLDAGTLNIFGTSASYQLNPGALAQRFPNLEGDGRGEGPAASDVLTVTLAISGVDADGQRRLATRTLTRFHDRLMTFEEFDRD